MIVLGWSGGNGIKHGGDRGDFGDNGDLFSIVQQVSQETESQNGEKYRQARYVLLLLEVVGRSGDPVDWQRPAGTPLLWQ